MGQPSSIEHNNQILRYSGCRIRGRRTILEDNFSVYLKFGKSWSSETTQTTALAEELRDKPLKDKHHEIVPTSTEKSSIEPTAQTDTDPTAASKEIIKEPIKEPTSTLSDQQHDSSEEQPPLRTKKKRKHTPDAGASLFAVFDGHMGDHCSKFLQRYLGRYIYNNRHYPHDIPRALKSAFLRLDRTYLKIALGEGRSSGAAAVALLVHGRMLYVANAGDCRAVLCEGGTAVPLSTDHVPSNQSELERIQRHGVRVKHGRLRVTSRTGEGLSLNVSRGFGSIAFKDKRRLIGRAVTAEPDVRAASLTRDSEFVVLASDGLWDVMSNEHVIDFVRTRLQDKMARDHPNSALFGITTALVDQAYLNGGTDNITCIIVTFTERLRHDEQE
jgi:protein phosphatase 2C family protein 2/3